MNPPNNPCQTIICAVPQDIRTYSLGGLPPLPPPTPTPPPPPLFLNQFVELDNICTFGNLTFSGSTPTWIQVDVPNNRIIGRAGAIPGITQSEANSNALNQLQLFYATAQTSSKFTCTYPSPILVKSTRVPGQLFTPFNCGLSFDKTGNGTGTPDNINSDTSCGFYLSAISDYTLISVQMIGSLFVPGSGYSNQPLPMTVLAGAGYFQTWSCTVRSAVPGTSSGTIVFNTNLGTCPFFVKNTFA